MNADDDYETTTVGRGRRVRGATRWETTRDDDGDVGESLCIPVSSISSPRSFVCDPRVVRACVSSRARARECHIAQTRKPLKNAREMALFEGRRAGRRRGTTTATWVNRFAFYIFQIQFHLFLGF